MFIPLLTYFENVSGLFCFILILFFFLLIFYYLYNIPVLLVSPLPSPSHRHAVLPPILALHSVVVPAGVAVLARCLRVDHVLAGDDLYCQLGAAAAARPGERRWSGAVLG